MNTTQTIAWKRTEQKGRVLSGTVNGKVVAKIFDNGDRGFALWHHREGHAGFVSFDLKIAKQTAEQYTWVARLLN